MSELRSQRERLEQAQATLASLQRGEPDDVVRAAAATLETRRASYRESSEQEVDLEKRLTDALLTLRAAERLAFERSSVVAPEALWLMLACSFACCFSNAFAGVIPPLWALGGILLISFVLGLLQEQTSRAIKAATRALR